jgi:hypothetical protein
MVNFGKILFWIVAIVGLAFQINASDKTDFVLGVEAMSVRDYETAITHFKNDIAKNPAYETYYNLGISFFEMDQHAAAIWATEYALYLNPRSKEAKHNAAHILKAIAPNYQWKEPFSSWTKFVVYVGALFWLMLAILLSVSAGLLFFMAGTNKQHFIKKQLYIALSINGLLLFFVVIAGLSASNHFEQSHFALPKSPETKTYISPNGLTLDQNLRIGNRYKILEKQKDWFKIELVEDHPLWVHVEDIYYY